MHTIIEPSRSMSHTDALASLRHGGTAVCCYKEQPKNKLVTLPPIDPSVSEPMYMYSQQERNQGRVLPSSHAECNMSKNLVGSGNLKDDMAALLSPSQLGRLTTLLHREDLMQLTDGKHTVLTLLSNLTNLSPLLVFLLK